MKLLLTTSLISSFLLLGSCSYLKKVTKEPPAIAPTPLKTELDELPVLDGDPIYIGVSDFKDLTGQRKQSDNYASFSSAVTQGAESWLIESLLDSGDWFKVLERGQLDSIMRERAVVQQTREDFTDNDTGLKPMLFAGILIHGGIIGYDTNYVSGGIGASYLGLGTAEQYRKDVVTVSIRFVSTLTSEILVSSTVSKTIYSASVGSDVFKYVKNEVNPLEIEFGFAKNEMVSVATRAAIDLAIINIVKKGEEKGMWKFVNTSQEDN